MFPVKIKKQYCEKAQCSKKKKKVEINYIDEMLVSIIVPTYAEKKT